MVRLTNSRTRRAALSALIILGSVAGTTVADFTFGEPVNLGALVNTSFRDGLACTSADGLSLFFASQRPEGYGGWDLWVAERVTTEDPWEDPANLGLTVNTSSWEMGPSISADGLTLFFQSNRPNGHGGQDLWAMARASTTEPWESPVNLGAPVNSADNEVGAGVSVNGTTLFFSSNRQGGYGGDDLYVATRPTAFDAWDTALNLGEAINTGSTERAPSLSADGRMLFFHSDRSGGSGSYDIWVTTRSSESDPWSTPVNLGPTVNSSVEDVGPTISQDGGTLFFMSMRSGGFGQFDAWQAPIIPTVDFDGDGAVDGVDIDIMIDFWGTDEPLCDIGPMPWGDGVVDVQDLIVLVEHFLAQSPPVNVNEDDDGGQVELEPGQILIVTLESNPTTGYRWEQVKDQESILEQIGEAEFKPSETGEPPLIGAGGWEILRFKAVSAGQMTLELVYHRSWEEGVDPLETFSIQVLVR
jgi:predicted secreted protein